MFWIKNIKMLACGTQTMSETPINTEAIGTMRHKEVARIHNQWVFETQTLQILFCDPTTMPILTAEELVPR